MPSKIDRTNAICFRCRSNQSYRNRWINFKMQCYCFRCYYRVTYKRKIERELAKYGHKLRSKTEYTDRYRFYSGTKTAQRMKREWTISFMEWQQIITKNCYYCNTTLIGIRGTSLDRIDNTKGYILSNVLPCCGWCNGIRSNRLTVEEAKIAIQAILEYRNHGITIDECI